MISEKMKLKYLIENGTEKKRNKLAAKSEKN